MNEVLPMLLVTVVGAVLIALCSRGLSRRERKWVTATFFLHVGFACAQVPIAYGFYGGSDMFLYFSYGEILAQMMEHDPFHTMPEVTALLLHQPHHLPMMIIGTGSSTGSMSALAAWSFYLLGPSKYATGIAFAMVSLSGKIAMYRVFRANIDSSLRPLGAIATLFLPSFVFWSSGLIKEAIAVGGFGWALLGLHLWIREGRQVVALSLVAAASVPIWFIKPYILFPFVLGGGAWYYWARSVKRGQVRVRPIYLAVASALGLGGIVLLGHYFPQFAPETFSDRTYELQQIGRGLRGGSNYSLGSEIPTSLFGQLAYAPLALLASLFRPAIFEVRNILMLANAVETTVLTLLLARIAFTRNIASIRSRILNDPFLVFCAVFVIAFGIAVGLTSTNLGTLSRYRSPILPFFAVLLFVLGSRRRAVSAGQHVHDAPTALVSSA